MGDRSPGRPRDGRPRPLPAPPPDLPDCLAGRHRLIGLLFVFTILTGGFFAVRPSGGRRGGAVRGNALPPLGAGLHRADGRRTRGDGGTGSRCGRGGVARRDAAAAALLRRIPPAVRAGRKQAGGRRSRPYVGQAPPAASFPPHRRRGRRRGLALVGHEGQQSHPLRAAAGRRPAARTPARPGPAPRAPRCTPTSCPATPARRSAPRTGWPPRSASTPGSL